MRKESVHRVAALLDSIKADFPRRKRDAEELMRQMGLQESLKIKIAVPDRVTKLPTFDSKVSKDLTPMLRARFDYAGSWNSGGDIWLSATEMVSCMKRRSVRQFHRALREDWEGSAPMVYPDDRLTLFGVTKGVPEDLVYLVWASDGNEPEVWDYVGFESRRFKNLERYLTWCLKRE